MGEVANKDGVTIYYNWINDKTELAVCLRSDNFNSYSNWYSGNVVIPESVEYEGNTYNVTSIGNKAFYDCISLTSVTIPNSVTSIGEYAFYGCTSLASVTIPNSVTSIGGYAFSGCSGLMSVVIGSGVKSIEYNAFSNTNLNMKTIWLTNTLPDGASNANGIINYVSYEEYMLEHKVVYPFLSSYFDVDGIKYVPVSKTDNICDAIDCVYNESAKNLVIPSTVICDGNTMTVRNVQDYFAYNNKFIESISVDVGGFLGNYSFCECSGLNKISLGSKVTSIGNSAFNGCSGLTSVSIPNSASSIGSSAFKGCSSLTSVTIGNSVTTIGSSTFSSCWSLNSITIPNSVTSISESVFYGCNGLTSVTIGNSVTSIGGYAFYGCSGLTSVIIPNSVTSIYNNAFQNCGALTSVVIGSGVTSIGVSAFSKTNLKKIIWLTNTPPTGASEVKGAINYVANDEYDISNKVVYPFLSSYFDVDGIRYVPVSLSDKTCDAIDCVYDRSAKDTKIASTVTYKGIAMTIKDVKPYIGNDNQYIESLNIDNDGGLGDYAFAGCHNLKSVSLGDNMTSIGKESFQWCSLLNKVTIGSKVKDINQYAFSGCVALPTITIPQAVTDIKKYVFENCKSLKEVIIADSEAELNLETYIFNSCPLDTVYIGRNINYNTDQNAGYSPFYRNTSLRAVKITDKETEISENEFYGCTNLQRVIIGDGVTTIGNWAFSGCSSLKFFTFGSEVTTIGQEAFSDCSAVTEITSRAITPPTCGTQALDDINKWECKLYVPKGHLADYQAAEQWKEFLFAEERDYTIATKYTLTYTVDGEVYKTSKVAEGEAITPEPAPTKEGYTFSGWSDIPETMPAQDVVVSGIFTQNFLGKCATPTISYNNGKLSFSCATDGVEFVSEITSDDIKKHDGNEISLTKTYTVSVYATKESYENSDVATKEIKVDDGDLNGDNILSVTDVMILIDKILKE